jgi:hypothetical protein
MRVWVVWAAWKRRNPRGRTALERGGQGAHAFQPHGLSWCAVGQWVLGLLPIKSARGTRRWELRRARSPQSAVSPPPPPPPPPNTHARFATSRPRTRGGEQRKAPLGRREWAVGGSAAGHRPFGGVPPPPQPGRHTAATPTATATTTTTDHWQSYSYHYWALGAGRRDAPA